MTIHRIAVPRRTFLRGVGAAITLPLLDAMVPAFTPIAKTAAKAIPRLGFIYIPNGVNVFDWRIKDAGTGFQLSPTLMPLTPVKNQVTVLSGLVQHQAESMGDGNGEHSRAQCTWLNGVHPKRTEGADVRAG